MWIPRSLLPLPPYSTTSKRCLPWVSHRADHTECILLWPASFTEHHGSKAHPCHSVPTAFLCKAAGRSTGRTARTVLLAHPPTGKCSASSLWLLRAALLWTRVSISFFKYFKNTLFGLSPLQHTCRTAECGSCALTKCAVCHQALGRHTALPGCRSQGYAANLPSQRFSQRVQLTSRWALTY